MALPKASSPAEAAQLARDGMTCTAGVLRLFTGAFIGLGKPVFTPPQNQAGVARAFDAGVDLLAHTIPTEGRPFNDELARPRAAYGADSHPDALANRHSLRAGRRRRADGQGRS